MSGHIAVTFQEAVDAVESLPEYQQEDLIKLVHRRLSEQRRELLAEHIIQAREEYASGEVKRGTVADLMRELKDENADLE